MKFPAHLANMSCPGHPTQIQAAANVTNNGSSLLVGAARVDITHAPKLDRHRHECSHLIQQSAYHRVIDNNLLLDVTGFWRYGSGVHEAAWLTTIGDKIFRWNG
ncbi:hypothetical protein CJF31_00001388 [Rutstroemia sp. NJR-2017a BVV2]|nr:hypothetical protein CJF31_00001388 [Rutstroemia sp. NJR-2017a BVV2]